MILLFFLTPSMSFIKNLLKKDKFIKISVDDYDTSDKIQYDLQLGTRERNITNFNNCDILITCDKAKILRNILVIYKRNIHLIQKYINQLNILYVELNKKKFDINAELQKKEEDMNSKLEEYDIEKIMQQLKSIGQEDEIYTEIKEDEIYTEIKEEKYDIEKIKEHIDNICTIKLDINELFNFIKNIDSDNNLGISYHDKQVNRKIIQTNNIIELMKTIQTFDIFITHIKNNKNNASNDLKDLMLILTKIINLINSKKTLNIINIEEQEIKIYIKKKYSIAKDKYIYLGVISDIDIKNKSFKINYHDNINEYLWYSKYLFYLDNIPFSRLCIVSDNDKKTQVPDCLSNLPEQKGGKSKNKSKTNKSKRLRKY